MFRFTPQVIPRDIFVIGGGGTGSRLMPMLAQFMRSVTRGFTPSGWVEDPRIWVVDADTVESKNLIRQNFIQSDVGKFKAQVLADRYSKAYGVKVFPITEYITGTPENIVKISGIVSEALSVKGIPSTQSGQHIMQNAMVISCVDSVKARRAILNTFVGCAGNYNGVGSTPLFIDAGNEDSFGQVNFFNPVWIEGKESMERSAEHKSLPALIGCVIDIDHIPMDINYYLGLVDTESTASCADLSQTLAINAIMATTIMGVVQNYYYRKPVTHNCVSISLDGGNRTGYSTYKHMTNLATSRDALHRTHSPDYNSISIKEKDDSLSVMRFFERALVVPGKTYTNMIHAKIKAEEEERARIELERAKLVRLQEIRAEIKRRDDELRAAEIAAKQSAEAQAVQADMDKLKEKLRKKRGITTPTEEAPKEALEVVVPAAATSAPPLEQVARSRPRTVVELPLVENAPDSEWVEVDQS